MKGSATGKERDERAIEAGKRSSMEANIVDTMRRYFENDKGKMGKLELSIIHSVKRYFEESPPKKVA